MLSIGASCKTWSYDSPNPKCTTTQAGETKRKTVELVQTANSFLSANSTSRKNTSRTTGSARRHSDGHSTRRDTTEQHSVDQYNEEQEELELAYEDNIEVVYDGGYNSNPKPETPELSAATSEAPSSGPASPYDLEEALSNARIPATSGHFIPRDALERILSLEAIRYELCRSVPNISGYKLDKLTQRISSYRRVFAILVLIGHTSSIEDFIEAGICDEDLPLLERQPLHAQGLKSGPSSENDGNLLPTNLLWDPKTEGRFLSQQWELIAPSFSESDSKSKARLYELHHSAILPFTTVGTECSTNATEGGFGAVHKVKIHGSHCSFTDELATQRGYFQVAVKRFKDASHREFTQELNALSMLQASQAKDPHLVSLIAAIKHGNDLMFLFPLADGDLRQFWINNLFHHQPDLDQSTWVARQTLGLARAINKIHNIACDFDASHGERSRIVHGRHGDIKPENILIFKAPEGGIATLQIADLGLARFHSSASKSYHEPRHTPTYRAPEFDLNPGLSTRAYDIWSLGCVFLEFLTWYSMGPSGLKRIATVRTLDGPGDGADDSYFVVKRDMATGSKVAVVKPSVSEWVAELHRQTNIPPLLRRLLEIIETRMLVVDVERRIDSRALVAAIEDAISGLSIENTSQTSHLAHRTLPMICENPSNDRTITVDSATSTEGSNVTNFRLQKLEDKYKVSLFDKLRLQIEQSLGSEIRWSPLPPVNRRKDASVARLIWEYGGREMFVYLDRHQFDRYRHRIPLFAPNPHGILPTVNTAQASSRLPGLAGYGNIWRMFCGKLRGIPQIWQRSNSPASKTTSPGAPANMTSTLWKESYFCIDKHRTTIKQTKMYTIPSVDCLKDDRELLLRLRENLTMTKGTLFGRLTSWRTCTKVRLSKFTFLFDNNDLVKALEQKIDGELKAHDVCKGYEYSKNASIDLPEHMQVMAEMILQGIHDPELGRNGRAMLDGIPKLHAPPGLDKKQNNSGWGFYTIQDLSLQKMLYWIGMTLLLGVVFVPIWLAKVDPKDLQNAFTPLTFIASLLSIVLAIVAVANCGI